MTKKRPMTKEEIFSEEFLKEYDKDKSNINMTDIIYEDYLEWYKIQEYRHRT